MNGENDINKVQLVFFSGTGGTKRVADSFEKEMIKRNLDVTVKNLAVWSKQEMTMDPIEIDLYILVFPVYALDAPMPVINWIRSLGEQGKGKRIAVISVSGGGEIWPNTGCRNRSCQELESKGFNVTYDTMMCMPANMLTEVNDHLAMWLIKVIPEKVNAILDDLLAGKIKRTHFHKSALRKYLTRIENQNASQFAHKLEITGDCMSCGWCVRNCPTANIEMTEQSSKPQFLDRCTFCLCCIYGCPSHAIKTNMGVIFKSFDLDALEKRMEGVELEPAEKCCKGLMFLALKKYLRNENK